jgi:hypothetical protein
MYKKQSQKKVFLDQKQSGCVSGRDISRYFDDSTFHEVDGTEIEPINIKSLSSSPRGLIKDDEPTPDSFSLKSFFPNFIDFKKWIEENEVPSPKFVDIDSYDPEEIKYPWLRRTKSSTEGKSSNPCKEPQTIKQPPVQDSFDQMSQEQDAKFFNFFGCKRK